MPQLFSAVLTFLSSPSRINFTTFHQRREGNDVETASTPFPSTQFAFIQDHSFHHSSVTVEQISFLYPELTCFWSHAWNSCFKMGGKLNVFMHQIENLVDGARVFKVGWRGSNAVERPASYSKLFVEATKVVLNFTTVPISHHVQLS